MLSAAKSSTRSHGAGRQKNRPGQPAPRLCARHFIVPLSHPARLISAPLVLPIASPALAEAAVVVDGAGSIVAVGPRAQIKSGFASLPEERAQGALLPGLVNAHTHIELSVLAGRLRGGEGLPAWAVQVGRETASFSAEQRLDAARRAALAAVAAGNRGGGRRRQYLTRRARAGGRGTSRGFLPRAARLARSRHRRRPG